MDVREQLRVFFQERNLDGALDLLEKVNSVEDAEPLVEIFVEGDDDFVWVVLSEMGMLPFTRIARFHREVFIPKFTAHDFDPRNCNLRQAIMHAIHAELHDIVEAYVDIIIGRDAPEMINYLHCQRTFDIDTHDGPADPTLKAAFDARWAAHAERIPPNLKGYIITHPDHPYVENVVERAHAEDGPTRKVNEERVDALLEPELLGGDMMHLEELATELKLYGSVEYIKNILVRMMGDRHETARLLIQLEDRVWLNPDILAEFIVPAMHPHDNAPELINAARLIRSRDGCEKVRAMGVLAQRMLEMDEPGGYFAQLNAFFPAEVGETIANMGELKEWVVKYFQVREGMPGHIAIGGRRVEGELLDAEAVVRWAGAPSDWMSEEVEKVGWYASEDESSRLMDLVHAECGDAGANRLVEFIGGMDRRKSDRFMTDVISRHLERANDKARTVRDVVVGVLWHNYGPEVTYPTMLERVVSYINELDSVPMMRELYEVCERYPQIKKTLEAVREFPPRVAGYLAEHPLN